MAQSTFSIRMDENLKREFDSLCSDFGMTVSTAINVFAKAVVREQQIRRDNSTVSLSRCLVVCVYKMNVQKLTMFFPSAHHRTQRIQQNEK